jgi:hypothetical protein
MFSRNNDQLPPPPVLVAGMEPLRITSREFALFKLRHQNWMRRVVATSTLQRPKGTVRLEVDIVERFVHQPVPSGRLV